MANRWCCWGLVALLLPLAACDDDKATTPPHGTTSTTTTPAVDCSAYEHDGVVYDCDELDECDASQDSIPFRLACCDCDPVFCETPETGACNGADTPTDTGPPDLGQAQSCMTCHNGSLNDDYAGTGIENPHWSDDPAVQYLQCTVCHGGDGAAAAKDDAHVPPPPEVGDDAQRAVDPAAHFQYLTRTGIERLPDYVVNGTSWQALEYLQFLNPGDTRVVSAGQSCGQAGCHQELGEWFARTPLAGGTGILSGASYGVGAPNAVPAQAGLYDDTAADYAFRAASDPSWIYDPDPAEIGRVGELVELPEVAVFGGAGIDGDPAYDAAALPAMQDAEHRVIAGSPLQDLALEAIGVTCGACHAGSAGPNQSYGTFRSSGCSSCHFPYSASGRPTSRDPNVTRNEPADPDQLVAPERPHLASHTMVSRARVVQTWFGPVPVGGTSDRACLGCHMGSNRTVLQYWGIRVDSNRDVALGTQYPAAPATYADGTGDRRLFDLAVQNDTFAGLTPDQLLVTEDYDGDGRDDTPPDIHYERGLGCIDCHGARDLHGGLSWTDAAGVETVDATSGRIVSRDDQTVGITCASCHGGVAASAPTVSCMDYDGNGASCAADRFGNPVRNVTVDATGALWLKSRVDGVEHYVPQVHDVVVATGAVHPVTGAPLFDANASFAMGTADGDPLTGEGPVQADPALYEAGFSHLDRLACESCHVAWTNSCFGCHLELVYDDDPAASWFSNVSGERIVLRVDRSDPVYTTPVWSTLAVGPSGRVERGQPGVGLFFRYVDLNGVRSDVVTFGDRNGQGNAAGTGGREALPALGHDKIAAHSIRGRPTETDEGVHQCVACHLNVDQIAAAGDDYRVFHEAMAIGDRSVVDFDRMAKDIGRNPGNQLNSPFFVHMNAGLGTGLLTFDAAGCAVNPLDGRVDRVGCEAGAPSGQYDPALAAFDLDGVVEPTGASNASTGRPMRDPALGAPMRLGDALPELAGPLGLVVLTKLADPDEGIVLDSWLDADGVRHP
jgi:hypothetical protein